MKHCKQMNAFKKESNTKCTNGSCKKWNEGCILVTVTISSLFTR